MERPQKSKLPYAPHRWTLASKNNNKTRRLVGPKEKDRMTRFHACYPRPAGDVAHARPATAFGAVDVPLPEALCWNNRKTKIKRK